MHAHCDETRTLQGADSLASWLAAFRSIQASEVWLSHGDWVQQHEPNFGPGIRERFAMAEQVRRSQAVG
jgi:amidase